MNEDERESAADALLSAAEGFSLPVMENPVDDVDNGANADKDGLYIVAGMLDTAKNFAGQRELSHRFKSRIVFASNPSALPGTEKWIT